jgi:hypothetical protein
MKDMMRRANLGVLVEEPDELQDDRGDDGVGEIRRVARNLHLDDQSEKRNEGHLSNSPSLPGESDELHGGFAR